MKIGKEFYEKVKENELYRKTYECLCCGGCTNLWPGEHRCSIATRYKGSEASPRGLNWVMQAVMEDKLLFSPGLVDLVFSCTTCNQCVVNCPAGIDPRVYIEALRKALVEEGAIPKTVKEVFANASRHGNVWGKPRNERSKWADGLKIESFSQAKDLDILLLVGCSGSYVERNQETAMKLVAVLNKAKVKFGFLGNEERCSGDEVLRMGEEGLFESLAGENIDKFREYGVAKIITLSPHTFDVLKKEYPKLDSDFKVEVMHYTQFLWGLIKDGKLKLTTKVDKKVTYQDPCYLGKHNAVYEEPREILRAIPGLELIEMDYSKEKGVCCGGGGGGVWIERGKGVKVEEIRFKQALDLGVDVLATACPFCTQQFEAANEEFDQHLEVKDIIELVYEAI